MAKMVYPAYQRVQRLQAKLHDDDLLIDHRSKQNFRTEYNRAAAYIGTLSVLQFMTGGTLSFILVLARNEKRKKNILIDVVGLLKAK